MFAKRQLSVLAVKKKRFIQIQWGLCLHYQHSIIVIILATTRELVAVEPRRPPMTDVGIETAFRPDQRKHFQKSKHLLRSEVS